jgi:hypothetical protein
VEFEGLLEVGDYTVGSAYALLEALEELREELDLDDDRADKNEDEEEAEEEEDLGTISRELAHAWRIYMRGAATCTKRQVPLYVLT